MFMYTKTAESHDPAASICLKLKKNGNNNT